MEENVRIRDIFAGDLLLMVTLKMMIGIWKATWCVLPTIWSFYLLRMERRRYKFQHTTLLV